jgi:hypothetical protein
MKVQVSHRLDEELLAWATEYGESRRTSRAVVIEEALRHFRGLSEGGVPDLPVVDTPAVREKRAEQRESAPDLRGQYAMERQAKLNAAKYRRAS